MSKRAKESLIQKTKINSAGFLNKSNYRAKVISFPKKSWYLIIYKSEMDLFTYDVLTKR